MKKIIGILVALLCIAMSVSFVACGGESVQVDSASFSVESVELNGGGEQAVTFSVLPEESAEKLTLKVANEYIAKYEDGKVKAVSAGNTKLQLVAGKKVYLECDVKVNPVSGYTLYEGGDYKVIYPSGWSKSEVSGIIQFVNGSTNFNIVGESKNNSYYSMSADTLANALSNQYKQVYNMTPTFSVKSGEVDNYLGLKRANFTFSYTLNGASITQKMTVINAGKKTYTLTFTVANSSFSESQTEIFNNVKNSFLPNK